jgi:hypothetical protein
LCLFWTSTMLGCCPAGLFTCAATVAAWQSTLVHPATVQTLGLRGTGACSLISIDCWASNNSIEVLRSWISWSQKVNWNGISWPTVVLNDSCVNEWRLRVFVVLCMLVSCSCSYFLCFSSLPKTWFSVVLTAMNLARWLVFFLVVFDCLCFR